VVNATAENGQETFKKLLALKNEVDGQIVSLGEMTGFKRNRLFMFEKYLHLF
jgi:hypothetical protein